MGDAYIKKTQATLGKIIKKPPLTDKLLKKPPFRFLHDVISEVVRSTGFMKGLYEKAEMDSQTAGKDKESKVAFLQKAIDVVIMVTGQDLTVRPSKIVAGHEPEKTNEFLQAMGMAISKKMDSKEAVQKVLKGEKPGAEKSSSEKSSKPPKGDKEESKSKSQEEDGEKERERKRDRHKDREEKSERKRSASRDKERDRDRSRDRGKEKEDRNKDERKDRERRHRDKDRHRDREKDKEGKHKKEEEDMAKQIQNDNDEEDMEPPEREGDEPAPGNRIPRPSSAKGQRRRPPRDGEDSDSDGEMELQNQEAEQRSNEERSQRPSRSRKGEDRQRDGRNDMVNGDDLPPQVQASRKMARPSSARPAPPRVKKQEALDDPAVRIGSGKVSNVIVDNAQNSDDDDDTFVVEEDQPAIEMDQQDISNDVDEDADHGGLVKKILETKKELEGGSQTVNKRDDKPTVVMDAAKRKERQIVAREIDSLRSTIQTLTRSANPLGKIMDYVQEDMDSMQKELEMWKKENRQHELAIKREESITEEKLEPLKSQLAELDQAIADQLDLISAVKANVLRNDEKIQKMMSSVTFASR
ncbi:TRAF3-interacting protein 1-like isoform X2 [Ptychodera flava]|uniref:TRAF3-interacting protein 1-like isoform X2 n=1 Tax=Ptychodera flava TaxID=63121 RepID=UPI00396A2F1F